METNQEARKELLSKKLRELRQLTGATQEEFAQAIGSNRSQVNRIEYRSAGFNLDNAEALVRSAYKQFSLPFDQDIKPGAQQIPLFQTPPAEVEPVVLRAAGQPSAATRNTRMELGRRINKFQDDYKLSLDEMSALFGVSKGHLYILRTGRDGSGAGTRDKIRKIIETETVRRSSQTEQQTVVQPMVRAAPAHNGYKSIALVPAAELANHLTCDYSTTHRFQALPDGMFLVVKG